ncbi:MAG: tetratricopeptide repeat protein [Synechococcaceae cyanobacterium SM2_3_1]|nr:tetratricopeptide repeat protein [Synechococcaceae cyanobacterium SM2_3_1]
MIMRAGNRRIWKSCLAGALLGLSLVVAPVRAESNVVDLVVAAIAAGEAEDWGQAVDLYRQALELEPNNAGLHNNLGVVLRRQGDLSTAIAAYRRATELDPNLSAAYVNLGLALLLEQRWSEALTALQTAADQIPDEATLLFYQGIAFENLENWPAAIDAYNTYLLESPDALGHYRLAIVYWQAGDPQQAVELFRRAARLEAEVGLYSSEAGRALALLGQWQDAAILLERLPERWMDPADF